MSTHRSFAIFGTGGIGSFIIDELLKLKESGAISTVKIASRSDSIKESHPDWFSRGGELVVVDYSDESTLLPALEGVEVAITALTFSAYEKQKDIIKAAKAAGARLFVTSEYGLPTDDITTGIWSIKMRLNEWLNEFGFPYVRVFCGGWPEYAFQPYTGLDLANGKATIGGSGDYKVSWTTREDIARFLGYALTHLTTSKLSGKPLRIEGDKLTYNEVIEAYEKKTGKKVEVTRIPRETLTERAAAGDMLAASYYNMDVHGGEVGEPLDNDLFPDWNPKKVLDVIS